MNDDIKKERKSRGPHSQATREKMSKSAKARAPFSKETRERMSRFHKGKQYRLGAHHTDETKALMSRVWHLRAKLKCEHCGREFYKAQATQWHNDKCAKKPSNEQ